MLLMVKISAADGFGNDQLNIGVHVDLKCSSCDLSRVVDDLHSIRGLGLTLARTLCREPGV